MAIRAGETPGGTGGDPAPAKLDTIPYAERVARGLVSGQVSVIMNSRSATAIAVGPAWTDVSDHPVFVPPVARKYNIRSDNLNDKPGDTGATAVFVWGLSSTGDQVPSVFLPPWQSESVETDGLLNALTLNEYKMINGIEMITVGSSRSNEGTITAQPQVDSVDTIVIEPGRGRSRDSVLSIPSGWRAVVKTIQPFWTGAQPAEWELRRRTDGGLESTIIDGEIVAANSGNEVDLAGGKSVEAETTIFFRARRNIGPAGEQIRILARVDLYVVDDGAVPDTLPLP